MNLLDITTPASHINKHTLRLRMQLAIASGYSHAEAGTGLLNILIEHATGLKPDMPDPAGYGDKAFDIFDVPVSLIEKSIGNPYHDADTEGSIQDLLLLAGKINGFIARDHEEE